MIRDGWFRGRKARRFTLQWHLTNACPFQCRHCYDRTDRQELDLPQALSVLEDFLIFCRGRRVSPHISLSGGDPMACGHFWDLYGTIAQAAVPISILGNPISAHTIRRLLEIRPPACYQVSLEGLQEHNDAIRGDGHFEMVMAFLLDARRLGLKTHVMLTLTRANADQVIPLGESLRGLTERFTFNRLSQVGNAVDMELPDKPRFVQLLRQYLAARRMNPVLGVKENLFSILRQQAGRPPFPGCTGFGCGAAFNFVALLPDGQVHACRKYPSLLGNIKAERFDSIYESPAARLCRSGPSACRKCRLRRHCRGCRCLVWSRSRSTTRLRSLLLLERLFELRDAST
jgi:selenobiotic family peptide radical SAM maturase